MDQINIGEYHLIPYYNKTRREWLHIRQSFKTKIGGSDIGTILNINPYASRAQLFDEKLGLTPQPNLDTNKAVFWGNELEPMVHKMSQYVDIDSQTPEQYMFQYYKGRKKRWHAEFGYTVWADHVPWIAANVDSVYFNHYMTDRKIHNMINKGQLPEDDGINEYKTMSGQVYDKWKTNMYELGGIEGLYYEGLAPGYVAQVYGYAMVFSKMAKNGVDMDCSVFVLVDGQKFRWYRIEIHVDFMEIVLEETYLFHLLLEQAQEIMMNTVDGSESQKKALDNIRPEPDDSSAYSKHLTEHYLRKIDITLEMEGTPKMQELRDQYLEVSQINKEWASKKQGISNEIKNHMRNNNVARLNLIEGRASLTKDQRLIVK